MKTAPNFWQRQKWLVIYNALVDPRPAAEIAQHAGVSVGTVHRVISKYNRKGVEARANASNRQKLALKSV
ncbi:MAG: hypothetical protein F6K50_51420 [Moorea sp. SIO3I7]|uniref:Helix-turn-helix domain-containing protein n=1 Tax=Moorena bouillonii PNG TaxID=568701 RepID=A0A1U7MYC4_9CYAN|nr:helix-turn-helix domain-containing protein [Moorena bouillonii]NEO03421.1 hypothetical protein [Moorena sp. SIO3I7]OLT58718.1 hypothetical protein BJP37_06350 [Moorena bouillonii PNG]